VTAAAASKSQVSARRGCGPLDTTVPAKPALDAHSSSRHLRVENAQQLRLKAIVF
jgi:hypothetical protein